MTFELTAKEIESEIKEAEALKTNKVWFVATEKGEWVKAINAQSRPENSYSSFWMAYAECAEKRGDIADMEYGLTMAQTSDKNYPETDF